MIDPEHQELKAKFLASVKRTSRTVDDTVKKTRMFCKVKTQDLINAVLELPAQQGEEEEGEDEAA